MRAKMKVEVVEGEERKASRGLPEFELVKLTSPSSFSPQAVIIAHNSFSPLSLLPLYRSRYGTLSKAQASSTPSAEQQTGETELNRFQPSSVSSFLAVCFSTLD